MTAVAPGNRGGQSNLHTKACSIFICMVQCMKFDCEKINLMSTAQNHTDLESKVNNRANTDRMGQEEDVSTIMHEINQPQARFCHVK